MRIRKSSALGLSALVAGGLLGGAVTAQATGGSPSPCEPSARACVDLATQQAWLQQDGSTTYGPVPLTSGKPGAETPPGTFRVQWKDADHHSGEFDAPMPNSVFFTTTGIAFHEGSLQERSNGCLHLSTTASQRFFDGLQPGDEVQVLPQDRL
ncbi:L,D-transpeptidase [Salinifilum aidingensis]